MHTFLYYNLEECDCTDSESDRQEHYESREYVNILPRGWFSGGDFTEFLRGHMLEGSVCSECAAPSDCVEEHSSVYIHSR